MLSYVQVNNLSLKSVLEIITRDLDLAYEVRGNSVVISSAENLAAGRAAGDALISAADFAVQIKHAPIGSSTTTH